MLHCGISSLTPPRNRAIGWQLSEGAYRSVSPERRVFAMMIAFLPVLVEFHSKAGTVHLKGACQGRNFDVEISRATLSFLLGAEKLNKKSAQDAVSRHKDRLQKAASIASKRSATSCGDIVIELDDYILAKGARSATRSTVKAG